MKPNLKPLHHSYSANCYHTTFNSTIKVKELFKEEPLYYLTDNINEKPIPSIIKGGVIEDIVDTDLLNQQWLQHEKEQNKMDMYNIQMTPKLFDEYMKWRIKSDMVKSGISNKILNTLSNIGIGLFVILLINLIYTLLKMNG